MRMIEVNQMEFKVKPIPSSSQPITYEADLCIGCNRCVQVCQCDVLFPGEKTPIVMYPGECYYCGACVMVLSPSTMIISLKTHDMGNLWRVWKIRTLFLYFLHKLRFDKHF